MCIRDRLSVGVNTISGTTGSNDRDLVTFVVGPGQQLTSFLITDFSETGGHFFGLGDSFTEPTGGSGFLFAGLVTDPAAPGFEVLGSSGGDFGGSGVPSVLGPGNYLAFFNETSGVSPNYTAELTIVPEPSGAVLLLGSVGLMMFRRRRK